jgi:hypothetical protein
VAPVSNRFERFPVFQASGFAGGALTFTYGEPDSGINTLKMQFLKQDMAFLEAAKRVSWDGSRIFTIDVEWCEQCEELYSLTLRVKREHESEDRVLGRESVVNKETLYKDLLVRRETFDKVMEAKERLG